MRRGVSLVEVLVILVPALLVVGIAVHLIVRGFAGERWNAGRLAGLDAVLVAGEHLRADLAGAAAGQLEVSAERLAIGPDAVYAPVTRGYLARNGRPLRAAPLLRSAWTWDAAQPSLLRLELDGSGVSYAAGVHVADRAARLAYPGFAE